MKYAKRLALILAFVFTLACLGGCGGDKDKITREPDARELSAAQYTRLNLAGTDALGRKFEPADSENKELYVGMFFYLTLGYYANHTGIYDVTQITNGGKNMNAFYGSNDESSPVGAAHFWGEPIWGYYQSDDEWVIRKQIEMLTLAGIDFLCFDNTNGTLFLDTVDIILRVLNEYAEQGWDVPKFMFYTAAADKSCIKTVYEKYYKSGAYKNLWFAPKGKPIITQMTSTDWDISNATEAAISEFFEFRYRQWPTDSFLRNGWSWIEFSYPQPIHTDMISVSAAQHTGLKFSDTTDNRGKGFDLNTMTNNPDKIAEGANYASQWERALSGENADKIKYIMLTQWNEWVAEKFWDSNKSEAYMVDGFNAEYSRDMEPVKGDYGDNYYMQTIQNVRKWKYAEAKHYEYESKTVNISDFDESVWKNAPAYLDFTGDCIERNHAAFDGSFNYTDDSNRNDIASVSVLHDDKYAYFRVTAANNITEYQSGDSGWMNILIGDGSEKDSFMGFKYAINKKIDGNITTVSKYSAQSGEWRESGKGDVYVKDNVMQVRVKLSDLGLSEKNYRMQIKITDNVKKASDPTSYFTSGDCAPIGRLGYSYGY